MKRIRAIPLAYILSLTLILLAANGCKSERCDVPFGIGGTIDIASADYVALSNVGGTATVNRGHRGIIVRCNAFDSYVAFEMSCPNCHDIQMKPDDRNNALKLTCPTCSSSFDLIYGNPLEGSVTPCPLYQYSTSLSGHLLTIM